MSHKRRKLTPRRKANRQGGRAELARHLRGIPVEELKKLLKERKEGPVEKSVSGARDMLEEVRQELETAETVIINYEVQGREELSEHACKELKETIQNVRRRLKLYMDGAELSEVHSGKEKRPRKIDPTTLTDEDFRQMTKI